VETIDQFESLQRKLVPLWRSIQQFSEDPQTIVVVPSLNVDSAIQGVKQQAYEERYLFLLLLLRQARARVIYVTSQAIHSDVVDYYLGLLPGVIASHAKKRLFLVSPLDGRRGRSPRSCSSVRDSSSTSDRSFSIPTARTWCRTTRRRSIAIWRCDWGFHSTVPIRNIFRSAPRAAPGASSPRKASRTRSASRTCSRPTMW
jgi:hypothetical protein